jgi:Flp pilus assembly protein CpaB
MVLGLLAQLWACAPPEDGVVGQLVVAPRVDVPAGHVLERADLEVLDLPPNLVMEGDVGPYDRIVGRKATAHLLPHEKIRRERLDPDVEGLPLRARDGAEAPPVPLDPARLQEVMIAAADLPAGRVVGREDLYAVQIDSSWLPEGTFLRPELVVGSTVAEPILRNELFRGERLARLTGGRRRSGGGGPNPLAHSGRGVGVWGGEAANAAGNHARASHNGEGGRPPWSK